MKIVKPFMGCSLLVLAVACSSNKQYAKTIADYVQTDKKGVWYDLDFKALEIHKLQDITVADSIAVFAEKKEKEIKRLEAIIAHNLESIKDVKPTSFWASTTINGYKRSVEKNTKELEKLKVFDPATIRDYNKRNPQDVLALLVHCKASYNHPLLKTRMEVAQDYIISPDGNTVYGVKQAKNK